MSQTDIICIAIIALLILGIIAWIIYLGFRIHLLEAKLNQSQFQIQKDQNAQAVDALSPSQLSGELTKDLSSGGSAGTAQTTISKP
jgi:hypothetical protein